MRNKEARIRVLKKLPGELPKAVSIENSLKALQEEVGGYIETVTFASDACIVCNEEGRLQGMPYNCSFIGVDFVGPILIAGVDGDEFCSLSKDYMLLLAQQLALGVS